MNASIATSVEKLVGEKVKNLPFDYNGDKNFFHGVVVCQKPNSDTKLVIRCDFEDRLWCFNFSDLKILS